MDNGIKIGVIGAGSFGITVSSLLAENDDVLVYSRNKERNERINADRTSHGITLNDRITLTDDIEKVAQCELLFPVVPSTVFREVIKNFSPYLKPAHIMIHATKGLDVKGISESELLNTHFNKSQVHTMSEIIRDETSIVRVGCLSGPNLAKEILSGQPAAAVIASEFDEVIQLGIKTLSSHRFFVFESHELIGAELAGAYKNIIALASGMLGGKGLGKNMQSILITRGLHEMIHFGMAMGTGTQAYLGTAGIGDLIATASSENSRNYTFGKRLSKGETISEILKTSDEIVEGVRTLKIIRQLAANEKIILPITEMIYKVVFEDLTIEKAINFLMRYSTADDVDFL